MAKHKEEKHKKGKLGHNAEHKGHDKMIAHKKHVGKHKAK